MTYKWEDAAKIHDPNVLGGTIDLDVYITYSNLMITLERDVRSSTDANGSTSNDNNFDNLKFTKFGLWGGNQMTLGKTDSGVANSRYAYSVDVNIVVRDKQGNIVDGTFYYPMVDIDVSRLNANGYPNNSYGDFYGTNRFNAASWNESLHGYSEQVLLESNFSGIYIPGKDGVHGTTEGSYTNTAYLSQIRKNADGTYLIYPAVRGSNGTQGTGDSNTFYSGFVTLANNTNGGLNLKYYGSSGLGAGGMETYMLSGSSYINHSLASSTGSGGNIQSTMTGNHAGDLSNGEVFGPSTVTTATGQTVVYTMTPDPGYRIKSVVVSYGTLDYTDGEESTEYVPVDSDGDGRIDYYVFTFSAIHADNAIHVEWEPDVYELTVQKNTVDDEPGTFSFTLDLWAVEDDDTKDHVPFDDLDIRQAPGVTKDPNTLGRYLFTLSSGGSVSIPDIPSHIHYKIEELHDDGWRLVSYTNSEGEMHTDVTSVFMNEKESISYKDVDVIKYWDDERDATGNRPDDLEITLVTENGRISSEDTSVLVDKGSEPDQWSYHFTIPDGVSVTDILETTPEHYTQTDKVIDNDTETYSITNSIDRQSISISKAVKGNMGDKTTHFRFVLHVDNEVLSDPETEFSMTWQKGEESGHTIPKPSVSGHDNALFDFTLSDGETITIGNIPYGATYEVQEEDADKNGYVTEITGDGQGTMSGDKTVQFTNTRNVAIPTDLYDKHGIPIWCFAAIGFLALAGVGIIRVRKIRKKR